MVFGGVYAVVVGSAILAQWGFFLATGKVPERRTEPLAIGFHLVAEGVVACLLIAAGAGLLAGAGWARAAFLVGVGMLLYTAVNSAGYFAQRRQWPMVAMFALLLSLALVSLALVLRGAGV